VRLPRFWNVIFVEAPYLVFLMTREKNDHRDGSRFYLKVRWNSTLNSIGDLVFLC
jgi:hypothetical protein